MPIYHVERQYDAHIVAYWLSMEVRPLARRGRKRLGDFLLDDGAVTRSQLDEALDVQKRTGERFGRVLARIGNITESETSRAQGMKRLIEDGATKVQMGITTIGEVLRVAGSEGI